MKAFTATIPQWALLPWESQVWQYPEFGKPGISYFAGHVLYGVIDCLLYRDEDGRVIGILNYYSFDVPPCEDPPLEKAGSVNLWIHPDHQRQGIGTALWTKAQRRWGVKLEAQRFTPAGAAAAEAVSRR